MRRYVIVVSMIILLLLAAGCREPQTGGPGPIIPYREITAAELLSRVEEGKDLLLVDVREDYEYNDGHIPGAILLPLGELMENSELLDRDKEIILICRSGRRSGLAAQFLGEEGFRNVYNMVGGMLEWQGPVTRVRLPVG